MKANDIARHLAAQVEGVVRLLLPKGKRQGHEWRVGSLAGEPGESMGVHMTGDKAGVWLDGATGECGDLIGLWMAVKGLDLRDACKEAMDYLGLREDRIDPPRKTYVKPTKAGVSRLSDEHRRWFEETRKIAPATIDAYRVATRDGAIMFPYLRDGELIAAKYRTLPKSFRQDAGCEPCLFGWQAMPANARVALICEGELDAMAWHTYGVCALSVPMGGGEKGKHTGWIESEYERLALLDTIFLSMDSDDSGQKATRDLCERLGRERCRVVTLPHKDANECLMQGVLPEHMAAAIRDARTMDPSELRDVGDFEDAIWNEYNRQDAGLLLPWKKTHELILMRPGEVSVWAGVNGHGKSTVVSQIVGQLAADRARVCVASMEYRTPMWMMRMNRQIAGVARPDEGLCRQITRALKGYLYAFDVQGAAKAKRIMEVFRYARRRYGTELFMIDNLTKCGFDDDDYASQKRFVEELSDFARTEETHVMLVAHMRKSESEERPSGKMGIKGSGGIADMCDTIVEVWRNKARERAKEEAREAAAKDMSLNWISYLPEKHEKTSDTLLFVHKQRASGKEPIIGLYFDEPSTQHLQKVDHRPLPMMKPRAVEVAR